MRRVFLNLLPFTLVAGLFIGTISSCKKETETITKTDTITNDVIIDETTIMHEVEIKTSETWKKSNRHYVSGFLYVREGATLTIEPGTVIKGVNGSKAAIIVERGAKIMAEGTATQPIVFTSNRPAGSRSYGDIGGIVICGKAKTNKADDGAGVGIAEGGIGSKYGGDNDADNSGVIKYMRIEFSGIPLSSSTNSEINGLTLCAVGNQTKIEYVQVSFGGDDSFEYFGGTVNCKNLVAYRGWDDDFDTDNGYTGKIQFGLSIRDPKEADQSESNGFESDNDAAGSNTTPYTSPVFSNITIIGPKSSDTATVYNALYRSALHLRRNTRTSTFNSVFVGYPKGLMLDGEKGFTPTNAKNNDLVMKNVVLAGMNSNFNISTKSTVNDIITVDEVRDWFMTTGKGNDTMSIADIKLNNVWNLTNPSLLPQAGSPLLSGASFADAKLAGLDAVAFIGAFGTEDWTAGWCNWDPQNTAY